MINYITIPFKCFFITSTKDYGIKLNGEKRNGGGYRNLSAI